KFLRADVESYKLSMKKCSNMVLHSSWNWELISDKAIDWWLPRLEKIKKAYPNHVLIASIMAGFGNDKELYNWQELMKLCQDAGADGLELNFFCLYMDCIDMGLNVGKDKVLCSVVIMVVKEITHIPI